MSDMVYSWALSGGDGRRRSAAPVELSLSTPAARRARGAHRQREGTGSRNHRFSVKTKWFIRLVGIRMKQLRTARGFSSTYENYPSQGRRRFFEKKCKSGCLKAETSVP
jgi:hypothetical protein